MTDRCHVFLSYSHTDREACIALRTALEQAGLSVFRDEDAIRVGDKWIERLEAALQGCSAFVLLVGRDGVERWVGAEAQVALIRHLSPHDDAQRLAIFPILLEDAKPEALPPFLALFQATRWRPADLLPDALVEAIRARATRFDLVPFEGCPFLGLNAFQQKDARLFFGRRQETLEALACLGDQQQTNPENLHGSGGANYCRWLQIEGNSGAGKSSLVNAGMLPMIDQGALWARTGFERWRVLGPMMPGRDPLKNLAHALEHALFADGAQRDQLALQERLAANASALASRLGDFEEADTAFLLVVDQFEELFTFAEEAPRKQFDALLANALKDPECPLFLISTVRADFLDRFEQLPRLQAIYNSRCKRFFLPTVSEQGLREVIEQPARLAGLDVSEVTTAILAHARDEIGALPLVENALFTLWRSREGNRLSGDEYQRQKGIVGMLSTQADDLLKSIDDKVHQGRQAALELLLRLTRIDEEGRHTRQRITREEAVMVAGNGNDSNGERVVQLLSGERARDGRSAQHDGALRLITAHVEQGQQYVDLIHETLIRGCGKDKDTGKPIGYWPTLYDYIDRNRDRELARQLKKTEIGIETRRLQRRLSEQFDRWRQSPGLGRWWRLAGSRDLWRYRRMALPKQSPEGRFLARSRQATAVHFGLLALVGGMFAEAAWWANENRLPPSYILQKPLWMLRYKPLPAMVEIKPGKFVMGCQPGRDEVEGYVCGEDDRAHEVTLKKPFAIGANEVTFSEYDYYVWEQGGGKGQELVYPPDNRWERDNRPVINVSWGDANA